MRLFIGLAIAALIVAAGSAWFVYSGVYDIAATDQHTAPVYWVLKTVMRRSVERHADAVDVPPLDDAALVAQGHALYQAQCVRCHGGPGIAPEPFALGLTPAPANLANAALEWAPALLFWTIKHGMKLTGMPAWQFRLRDDEVWAIVAYMQHLPYESPRQYRDEITASQQAASPPARHTLAGPAEYGNSERGRHVLQQYGCIVCHEIPGVVGATVPVGPPLDGMGLRRYISGVVENTPANIVRFLMAPEQIIRDGAMPNLGVREQDARDMAAYLETLR